MIWLAGIIVAATGLWLAGPALSIVIAPARAGGVLGRFASSAQAHYAEQVVRLTAGAAMVIFAIETRFPDLIRCFGWIIIVTTSGLLLIPWRWHQWFAQWAIPQALRHIKLFALGAFVLGAFLLYAVLPR